MFLQKAMFGKRDQGYYAADLHSCRKTPLALSQLSVPKGTKPFHGGDITHSSARRNQEDSDDRTAYSCLSTDIDLYPALRPSRHCRR